MTDTEEVELRSLVAKESPMEAKTLSKENLGLFGLGMMAAWYLFPEDLPENVQAA
jgi:hypothetical protein